MSFVVCGINHLILSIIYSLLCIIMTEVPSLKFHFSNEISSHANDSWAEEWEISEKKVVSVLSSYILPPPFKS
jgi:hypothetical protein